MASFSAELHVAGHIFPVTHCRFDVTQATQLRGRVSAKVRYGPVQLVLDVPDGDVLPAWAADPHKRQATAVVFLDANGGRAVETLRLPAAYCVAYQEQFSSGDAAGGAYQCFLTLSDPSGWTIAPGGPATAFVAPAAREHGGPVSVGAMAETLRPVAMGSLEAGTSEALSRGAANQSAFHPLDPLPLASLNKVHGQSTGFTCVASSLRMVLADKGFTYSENTLAEALNTSSYGASIMHIPDALVKLQLADQLSTTLLNRASFAELAAAVGQGSQAIVSVTIPGLGAHALVVEEVTETHVHIRDPLPLDEGSTYKVKISDFETYWNKRATIIHA